jgi:hypothetical protein
MQGAQRTFVAPRKKHPHQTKNFKTIRLLKAAIANKTVEGEGDTFQFDNNKTQNLVPYRHFNVGRACLKGNHPIAQASQ